MNWIRRERVKIDRVAYPWLIKEIQTRGNQALVLMGKIVNGADADNSLWQQPEGSGLDAIAESFRYLGLKDGHEIDSAEWIVYDAVYAYCQEMVRRGEPNGAFKDSNRMKKAQAWVTRTGIQEEEGEA